MRYVELNCFPVPAAAEALEGFKETLGLRLATAAQANAILTFLELEV